MAEFTKFYIFPQDLANKQHDLSADTFKVMLTNADPGLFAEVKADITEIAAANGYTAGGKTCSVFSSFQTGGVEKWKLNDPSAWTATGAMGPFRYVVLYNSTNNKLIGYYDYGSSITLANTETFSVLFDGTNGVLQIS